MTQDKKRPSIFLTIAGNDPCGGAGLQADLRVAQALGCYGMGVVSALTVQTTLGVEQSWPMTHAQIARQGLSLIADIRPDAIKVGMLGNADAANGVLEVLRSYGRGNIVIDTIIQSTSGTALYDSADTDVFNQVLRCARIITPNLPEASQLLTSDAGETEEVARRLSSLYGGVSVYLKGGHGDGEMLTDVFYNAETDNVLQFSQPRIATRNTHGTGCALSSALACLLARGFSLDEAAGQANKFLHLALINSAQFVIGHGHGPSFI